MAGWFHIIIYFLKLKRHQKSRTLIIFAEHGAMAAAKPMKMRSQLCNLAVQSAKVQI